MKVFIFLFTLSLFVSCHLSAQVVRPAKGVQLAEGDFIEYSNKMIREGKATPMHSTIMVCLGSTGRMFQVMVFKVEGEKVLSSSIISFDTSKEPEKKGKLKGDGVEELTVNGESYPCRWEKREQPDGSTVTIWSSEKIPFEKRARVAMELSDGSKTIVSEVMKFGPKGMDETDSAAFAQRLFRLMSGGQ